MNEPSNGCTRATHGRTEEGIVSVHIPDAGVGTVLFQPSQHALVAAPCCTQEGGLAKGRALCQARAKSQEPLDDLNVAVKGSKE